MWFWVVFYVPCSSDIRDELCNQQNREPSYDSHGLCGRVCVSVPNYST